LAKRFWFELITLAVTRSLPGGHRISNTSKPPVM